MKNPSSRDPSTTSRRSKGSAGGRGGGRKGHPWRGGKTTLEAKLRLEHEAQEKAVEAQAATFRAKIDWNTKTLFNDDQQLLGDEPERQQDVAVVAAGAMSAAGLNASLDGAAASFGSMRNPIVVTFMHPPRPETASSLGLAARLGISTSAELREFVDRCDVQCSFAHFVAEVSSVRLCVNVSTHSHTKIATSRRRFIETVAPPTDRRNLLVIPAPCFDVGLVLLRRYTRWSTADILYTSPPYIDTGGGRLCSGDDDPNVDHRFSLPKWMEAPADRLQTTTKPPLLPSVTLDEELWVAVVDHFKGLTVHHAVVSAEVALSRTLSDLMKVVCDSQAPSTGPRKGHRYRRCPDQTPDR